MNEASHIGQSDRRNESRDTNQSVYTIESRHTSKLSSKKEPHRRVNVLPRTPGDRIGYGIEVEDGGVEREQRVETHAPSVGKVFGSSVPSSTMGKNG